MRCDLLIFSGCVCHLEQLHAQSPFLFPIVFSINNLFKVKVHAHQFFEKRRTFNFWISLLMEKTDKSFVFNYPWTDLIEAMAIGSHIFEKKYQIQLLARTIGNKNRHCERCCRLLDLLVHHKNVLSDQNFIVYSRWCGMSQLWLWLNQDPQNVNQLSSTNFMGNMQRFEFLCSTVKLFSVMSYHSQTFSHTLTISVFISIVFGVFYTPGTDR